MQMVGHYHIAYQGKAVLLAVKFHFLKEDSAEFFILKIGVILISVRGDEMNIGVIIELGKIFVQYHFPSTCG